MSYFDHFSHIHLVGIKGVAMTSLAQCLADIAVGTSMQITGSDVAEDFVTAGVLDKFGFKLSVGFDPSHITDDVDLVVYTGAHQGKQNPEVQEARKRGIPTLSHANALGKLMEGKKGISVCGTGGKSTTSAMIAWILDYAGMKPSYAIGVGNIPNLGRTGRYMTESEWFVAEADEYAVDPADDHRPRFIYQHPEIIVCTNLSYDHPDIYPSFEQMQQTFASFFTSLPEQGVLIWNAENELLRTIVEEHQVKSSGVFPTARTFQLLIPGTHNQLNAAYAYQVATHIGIDDTVVRAALEQFRSTMRRFEYKGQLNGVDCYDDYAHTPDEIRSTLSALREWYPDKRIVCAFQPHTYSRTKALFDGFAAELSKANALILLDIFASARESVDPTVSSSLLAQKISSVQEVIPTYAALAEKLPALLHEGDVFITLGAGDIYKAYDHVALTKEPANPKRSSV